MKRISDFSKRSHIRNVVAIPDDTVKNSFTGKRSAEEVDILSLSPLNTEIDSNMSQKKKP